MCMDPSFSTPVRQYGFQRRVRKLHMQRTKMLPPVGEVSCPVLLPIDCHHRENKEIW